MFIVTDNFKINDPLKHLNVDRATDLGKFLVETNELCEWICEIFLKINLYGFCMTVFLAIIVSVIIAWTNDNFSPDHFFRPTKLL